MNYFDGIDLNDEKAVKKQFRKMCLVLHPDKPSGSNVEFLKLHNQYEDILRGTFKFTKEKAKEQAKAEESFVHDELWVNQCEGLIIELTGTWIWLDGETFKYKDLIKENGFKWSRSKSKWFKAPAGTKFKKNKRGTSFGKIKSKYGYQSKTIKVDTSNRLN